MSHPFDQVENRTVLAKAERLYEESLGPVRSLISERIATFTDVLSAQEPHYIAKARDELARFLKSIEQDNPMG